MDPTDSESPDLAASPFHSGEIAAQTRAGTRETVARHAHRFIRRFMPDQHRELFEKLPMILTGTVDADGQPWASVLVGRPGFVRTPDERTLEVNAVPARGDPLRANLAPGIPIGMLGIELPTRRRNRLNGTVLDVGHDGFRVRVEQSFGNCPQYIQARTPTFVTDPQVRAQTREVLAESASLSARARDLITRSDTSFLATAAAHARGNDEVNGCDVSHRGGNPGFIGIEDERDHTVLYMPDFRGNGLFNSFGNLEQNPRAGLLFIDFDSGDVLSLTGTASILWEGEAVERFAGAQRMLCMIPQKGVWLEGAMPLRWSAPQRAKQLADTGP